MIMLNGYYGAGNFGDDIILLSIINSIREAGIQEEISVIAINKEKLPKLPENVTTIKRSEKQELIEKMKECNMLITGGGGIFQDYSGFNMDRHILKRDKGIDFYTIPMEIAYLMEKPIMLYAVGVGPINNTQYKRFFEIILKWADVITVRDKTSFDNINQIQGNERLKLTADPGVNFLDKDKRYTVKNSEYSRCVGICLRDWFLMKDEELFLDELAQSVDYITEYYGMKVVIFPFCTSGKDKELLQKLYEKINNKSCVNLKIDIDIDTALEIVTQVELLIGMRLHSLIVASSTNIPIIGINYDNKIEEYLKCLGLEDYNINLDEFNHRILNRKIDNLMYGYYGVYNKIKKNINILRKKERKNIESLINLIGGDMNG